MQQRMERQEVVRPTMAIVLLSCLVEDRLISHVSVVETLIPLHSVSIQLFAVAEWAHLRWKLVIYEIE